MDRREQLRQYRETILTIASQHGAFNVRVFGSVVRGEATPESDIDLLVKFEPHRSLLDQIKLQQALEDLLGCRVEVISEDGLYWLLRRRILKEAQPLFSEL
jgi:predicted nucleotidyltransferase